jgi:hypothetical protein
VRAPPTVMGHGHGQAATALVRQVMEDPIPGDISVEWRRLPRSQLPATHDPSDISKASLIELNERLSTGKTVYGTSALRLRRRLHPLTGRIDRATVQPLSDRPSLNSGWRVLSEYSSHSR